MVKSTKEVRGTLGFCSFFESLVDRTLKREISKTLDLLKIDCTIGDKIQHKLWPKNYIKKYGITNLWRYRLDSNWRLLYHIVGESDGLIVYVIEILPHSEYEQRFGY